MKAQTYLTEHTFTNSHPFPLEGGSVLPGIRVRYHCSPGSHHNRRVIWICHALTANSNPCDWWPTLVGKGKFFDPFREFIICANVIGSCYGSTQPDGPDFPLITIRDMVQAHELLRRELGIEEIHLLIGGSSGGFQAVEWAVSNPSLIKNLCLIACSARISPWATALNESQRMALLADSTFANGNSSAADGSSTTASSDKAADGSSSSKTANGAGRQGLAAARSIALLSYRSYEGYCQTQAEACNNVLTATRACSYQQYQGEKLANRFCAYSYYVLTRSLDSHNVGRGRSSVEKALSQIAARTLCIGIDSDLLFPLSEIDFMARHIPEARKEVITSDFGHDGFLLEYEQITSSLCKFLNLEEVQ
ncbi:MAG: alpha/beta fold hydrolase [Bacteroidales bacterium]|nr:alpha/beta fold hydrolase [Bacteroidales bacterium]